MATQVGQKNNRNAKIAEMLNNTRIRWTSEAKYLGLTIDQKLTWNSHTTKVKRKGFIAISHIYPVFGSA